MYRERLYYEDSNYKTVIISDKKLCYVFCSSNGIWDNYTQKSDYNILRERYEWINISKNNRLLKTAGKYIFVRDVFQKSYVDGLNFNINSIDKIIDLLKKETSGYKVITVGTSGGGYIAMILGYALPNCIRVFSFGGLFSLYSWTGANNNYSFYDVIEYRNHLEDSNYSKYFSIKNLISLYEKPLIHFYGTNHISDCIQLKELEHISNNNIKLVGIKTSRHGGDFYGFSYPYLLSASTSKILKTLHKNNIIFSKNKLAIKTMGLINFLWHINKKILKKVLRIYNI